MVLSAHDAGDAQHIHSHRQASPAVTNHMKVRRREKAGRKQIALHQIPTAIVAPRSGGRVHGLVGSPNKDHRFTIVNHVWAHDPIRRDELAGMAGDEYSAPRRWLTGNTPPRQYKNGRDGQILEVFMGKQRREPPQDSIFANNPFVDGSE